MPFTPAEIQLLWGWRREENPTVLSELKKRMIQECGVVCPTLSWSSSLRMRLDTLNPASKTICMTIMFLDLFYEVIICRDTGRILRISRMDDAPDNYDHVPAGMQDLTLRNVPLQLTSDLVFDGMKVPDGYSSFLSNDNEHDDWKACDSMPYTPDEGWFLARTLIPEQRFLVIVKDKMFYAQHIYAICFDTQRRVMLWKFVEGGDTPAARGACLDGENLVVFLDDNTNDLIHTTLFEDSAGTSDADTFGYKTAQTWTFTVPLEQLISSFDTFFQQICD